MCIYDVVVIGAGPAGLAAGIASFNNNASILIIERENRPGGILKQCIHDGFGLIKFKEKLSGPEYAERFIKSARGSNIPVLTSTFVLEVKRDDNVYTLTLVNSKDGIFDIKSKTIILANGCRERTAKQVFIHGDRPSGVYTAGTAQYLVNILGLLPCKRCVILGSGDIGLIMARRLTLEGAQVLGVYEAKETPSGLTRNIVQCLEDYSIPLYLSQTITKVFGDNRVEGVEVSSVDSHMVPIPGTQKRVDCDGVILSVGLIPENEIAQSLNIEIDSFTKGPYVDQNFMTLMDGVFSCGNALHVNDLVDYVSESGEIAGERAAAYTKSDRERKLIPVKFSKSDYLYVVPQYYDFRSPNKKIIFYLRSGKIVNNVSVEIKYTDTTLFYKVYEQLKPPEMERIALDISSVEIKTGECLEIEMLGGSV